MLSALLRLKEDRTQKNSVTVTTILHSCDFELYIPEIG